MRFRRLLIALLWIASSFFAVAPALADSFMVTTDLFRARLSTQGGALEHLALIGYSSLDKKDAEFALFDPKHRYAAQSGLIGAGLPGHQATFHRVPGPSSLSDDSNELRVRFEAAGEKGITVSKTYVFKRGSYLVDVVWEVRNGRDQPISPHAYFQLQRDDTPPASESKLITTFTGPAIYTAAEKYQKIEFRDLSKETAQFAKAADNGWLAMVQHYFVTAWIPADKTEREFYVRKLDSDNVYQIGAVLPFAEIHPHSVGSLSAMLYAGPQEASLLKSAAQGLHFVQDHGWLTIVAAPVFWALQSIYELVGNWGWAIIILTVAIKLLFFPLSAASYRSMAKMKILTPRLLEMKARYGSDKSLFNQEMMKLYQEEKVNPLGGCLPLLVQVPVFISLYWVLIGAVEMRDAPWILWIHDLATPDPFYILPGIMMLSMLVQAKMSPPPTGEFQAKIMLALPFLLGVMFFWFPSGLVLYWVVNNIVSITQQWQISRMIEREMAA